MEACPHTIHGSENGLLCIIVMRSQNPTKKVVLGPEEEGVWYGEVMPERSEYHLRLDGNGSIFSREWEGLAYCKDQGEGQLLRAHLPLHMCVSVSL